MTSINNYESVELPKTEVETKRKGIFGFAKNARKHKFNFTLKKKHIAMAALVLMLSAAVYINYLYSTGDLDGLITTDKNYGDSILVKEDNESSGEVADVASYFSEARISRQQSRDEAVQTIQNLVSADATEDQIASLSQKAEEIAANMELETKIESMIKAKGFNDCIVYISGEYADVMVETDGLLATEAALIKEAIVQETSVPVENISIVEVNG